MKIEPFIHPIRVPVVLALALLVLMGGPVAGQEKELVEAAKKEGKVTIFGSIQADVVKSIQSSFERKYPGVKTTYWRASTTAVMDRAMNEFRSGKVSWDVFFTGVDAMDIMRKEGMFLKYQTPAAVNFDKQFHHEFYSPNYRSSIIGFVYNTRYIKPADAPKSYWDYLDPKWDGKTTMSDPTVHSSMVKWLSSLHLVLGGVSKEEEYIQRLGATRPLFHPSLTPAIESIANGERPLGIAYIKYVCDMGKNGVPLDYVRLPAYLSESNYIAVGAKAQNPNAAKLWIDHWYSRESAEALAQDCEFVTLGGVYPPLKDADKIKTVEEIQRSDKDYKQLGERYGKIFRR
ncbi:MAG TPA: extracellular solute-binding protein [Candidatus Acidoferrales bacterium]|nr:extracellular solute-binding protein [Candidatus Acidoferrales bacterium]